MTVGVNVYLYKCVDFWSTSLLSLSKIAHQIWCDYPFSKRGKATERAVGVRFGGDKEGGGGGGVDRIWKRGSQCRGGLLKVGD